MYYSNKQIDHNINDIIKRNKILFLEKLELLQKDEYNCIINNGMQSNVLDRIVLEILDEN